MNDTEIDLYYNRYILKAATKSRIEASWEANSNQPHPVRIRCNVKEVVSVSDPRLVHVLCKNAPMPVKW